MNNYFEDSMRIKVYDDGRVINTIEIRFNDNNKSYEMKEVYDENYDYYEDRYFE